MQTLSHVIVFYDIADETARDEFRTAITRRDFDPCFVQATESVYQANYANTDAKIADLVTRLRECAPTASSGTAIILAYASSAAGTPVIQSVTIV